MSGHSCRRLCPSSLSKSPGELGAAGPAEPELSDRNRCAGWSAGTTPGTAVRPEPPPRRSGAAPAARNARNSAHPCTLRSVPCACAPESGPTPAFPSPRTHTGALRLPRTRTLWDATPCPGSYLLHLDSQRAGVVSQQRAQLCPSSMQSGHHRPNRGIHDLGNLLVGKPLHVGEVDRQASILGQVGQGLFDDIVTEGVDRFRLR